MKNLSLLFKLLPNTMDIDILNYMPKGCDYPNYRYSISKHGNLFKEKFCFISEHNTRAKFDDIDDFLIKEYIKLGFHYIPEPYLRLSSEDWCDVAIKNMLKKSKSDIFLIMHHDFMLKDWDKTIDMVKKELENGTSLVGYDTSSAEFPRIQPAFFCMRRDAYERSCKDFAVKDGFDHMEFISKDVWDREQSIKSLQDMGFKQDRDFKHMAGVTQTYTVGFDAPELLNDQLYVYFDTCLKLPVAQSGKYTLRVEQLLKLKNRADVDFNRYNLTNYL